MILPFHNSVGRIVKIEQSENHINTGENVVFLHVLIRYYLLCIKYDFFE